MFYVMNILVNKDVFILLDFSKSIYLFQMCLPGNNELFGRYATLGYTEKAR